MKKHTFILIFISIYIVSYCYAQDIKQSVYSRPAVKGSVKPGKGTAKTRHPNKPVTPKGAISVTTDEDCTFKIGSMDFGSLKKGETKIISVAYGSYELMATNAVTSDEYRTDVNIKGNAGKVQINFNGARLKRERMDDSLKTSGERKKPDTAANIAVHKGNDTDPNGQVKTSATDIVRLMLSNMVPVPGGNFIMGNELGYNDEGPEHTVTVRGIQFSKYEVTQQQWETIMGTNPSNNKGCKDCPVENVSRKQVDSFLIKINTLSSGTFRLPTEAEWEYVARKGGDAKDVKQKAWYEANSGKKTHPVGTKLPNALGIYDLLGNVAEWCSDWYKLNYYKNKSMNNPAGPVSGKEKVVRGGSYLTSAGTLRPSYRARQYPESGSGTTGLRLVMDAK